MSWSLSLVYFESLLTSLLTLLTEVFEDKKKASKGFSNLGFQVPQKSKVFYKLSRSNVCIQEITVINSFNQTT